MYLYNTIYKYIYYVYTVNTLAFLHSIVCYSKQTKTDLCYEFLFFALVRLCIYATTVVGMTANFDGQHLYILQQYIHIYTLFNIIIL